jgi:hypothetical protein
VAAASEHRRQQSTIPHSPSQHHPTPQQRWVDLIIRNILILFEFLKKISIAAFFKSLYT